MIDIAYVRHVRPKLHNHFSKPNRHSVNKWRARSLRGQYAMASVFEIHERQEVPIVFCGRPRGSAWRKVLPCVPLPHQSIRSNR